MKDTHRVPLQACVVEPNIDLVHPEPRPKPRPRRMLHVVLKEASNTNQRAGGRSVWQPLVIGGARVMADVDHHRILVEIGRRHRSRHPLKFVTARYGRLVEEDLCRHEAHVGQQERAVVVLVRTKEAPPFRGRAVTKERRLQPAPGEPTMVVHALEVRDLSTVRESVGRHLACNGADPLAHPRFLAQIDWLVGVALLHFVPHFKTLADRCHLRRVDGRAGEFFILHPATVRWTLPTNAHTSSSSVG
mmetsp:Transcript_107386/g.312159  ORF Transcript_107386/g.312159 Transcript_107386/m.312159 type:complete len:246 (+) Transcript_107386:2546-3283(+)